MNFLRLVGLYVDRQISLFGIICQDYKGLEVFVNRMKRAYRAGLLIPIAGLLLTACTCLPKGISDLDVGIKDRGIASWYGQDFHGWMTANGEIYDMEALTAAHRTLPLGTVVRVTNVMNGKQTRVRINDRGPYVNGRILDLSHAAAGELDMVKDGITPVQLEVIGYDEGLVHTRHTVPASLVILAYNGVSAQSRSVAPQDARRHRPIRLAPADVMRERRARRVRDILAAEQRADIVAALQLA
jgi:rare lipoprotein A